MLPPESFRHTGVKAAWASAQNRLPGEIGYVFSVGSTGDPPVPSGDPPDGTGSAIERKGAVS